MTNEPTELNPEQNTEAPVEEMSTEYNSNSIKVN